MINSEDFRDKLGKWFLKLEPFFKKKEANNIYDFLKKESKFHKITPISKDTFRVFQEVFPKNLKVVMVLMDPYPGTFSNGNLQACGVALDCRNGIIQPSLSKFYEGIEEDLGITLEKSNSLKYLTEQGVLLLNSDLTTRTGEIGAHSGIWRPFQKYLFEEALSLYPGLIYVLCGKSSQSLKPFISSDSYIFEIAHPSFAARTKTIWDTKGIFQEINRLLFENNALSITWNKANYDTELPF